MKHSTSHKLFAIFIIAGLALSACNATNNTGSPSKTPGAKVKVSCEGKRPQAVDGQQAICPANYDPVCATPGKGQEKTYSNACAACADQNVSHYVKGACAGGSSGGGY